MSRTMDDISTWDISILEFSYLVELAFTNLEEKFEVFAKSYIMSHKQSVIDFNAKWCSRIINHFFWQDELR